MAISDLTPQGYIYGLEIEYSTATSITVKAGVCRDDSDTANIKLSTSIIKNVQDNVASSWAEGSGTGISGIDQLTGGSPGYNSGIGDTCHIFVIKNPTNGDVDVLVSNSFDSPVLPTDYTLKRWVGALVFSAANTLPNFIEHNNRIYFKAIVQDYASTSSTTAALLALTLVPVDIKCECLLNVDWPNASDGVYITDPDIPDVAPSQTVAPGSGLFQSDNDQSVGTQLLVITDTSAQIRHRVLSGTPTIYISTASYRYKR